MRKYKTWLLLFCLFSCSKKMEVKDPYALAPKKENEIVIAFRKKITSKLYKKIIPQKKDILNLADLIDIALLNNPYTKESWANAKFYAASYSQNLYQYFPEVNIDSSYTREKQTFLNTPHKDINGKKFITQYQTVVNPEVTFSYLLFDFGKRKSSTKSAKNALYVANLNHGRNIQTIVNSTMIFYFKYQYQRDLFSAKKKDLENAKVSLDAAEKKFLAQITSKDDMAQAETEFLQNKIDFLQAKNDLKVSYANLLNSLGLESNKELNIEKAKSNLFLDFFKDNLSALIAKAQKCRLDYMSAFENFQYFKNRLKYAKKESLPNVNTYFEIGRNYYDKGIHENYHFSASVKLTIPIFKGFFYKNEIKKAKANLFKASATLEQKRLQIINDVTVSNINVKSSIETLQCAKKYLKAAKLRFKIALKKYIDGTNSILDLLASQSSLEDARAKKALAKKDFFSSICNLSYSTGSIFANEVSL